VWEDDELKKRPAIPLNERFGFALEATIDNSVSLGVLPEADRRSLAERRVLMFWLDIDPNRGQIRRGDRGYICEFQKLRNVIEGDLPDFERETADDELDVDERGHLAAEVGGFIPSVRESWEYLSRVYASEIGQDINKLMDTISAQGRGVVPEYPLADSLMRRKLLGGGTSARVLQPDERALLDQRGAINKSDRMDIKRVRALLINRRFDPEHIRKMTVHEIIAVLTDDATGHTDLKDKDKKEDYKAQQQPASTKPDGAYTVAALRDMTRLANTTLNKYAKMAGVPTSGRGGRNHRYSGAQARAILEAIISHSSESSIVNRCRDALKNLK